MQIKVGVLKPLDRTRYIVQTSMKMKTIQWIYFVCAHNRHDMILTLKTFRYLGSEINQMIIYTPKRTFLIK